MVHEAVTAASVNWWILAPAILAVVVGAVGIVVGQRLRRRGR